MTVGAGTTGAEGTTEALEIPLPANGVNARACWREHSPEARSGLAFPAECAIIHGLSVNLTVRCALGMHIWSFHWSEQRMRPDYADDLHAAIRHGAEGKRRSLRAHLASDVHA